MTPTMQDIYGAVDGSPGRTSSEAPLRVLQIIETSGGGSGRNCLDLVSGLVERGHEVHVAYAPDREDAGFAAGRAGLPPSVSFSRVSMRRAPHASDVAALRSLRAIVERHGPFDVVHGQSTKGGILARLLPLPPGVIRAATPHAFYSLNPKLSRVERALYNTLERLLAPRTDLLIAAGVPDAEVARGLGFDPEQVVLIPNGITPPADLRDRSALRRAWGVPDAAFVVGFVGRLAAQKAPERVLDAFAQTAGARSGAARLVVVGDGRLRPELEARAHRLGIAARVRWLGETSGQAAMPGFDVLLTPSLYEGMPYVFLEALAAGLPIVATRVGGVELTVEEGINGHVIDPWDPEACAAVLDRLAAEPDLKRVMSARSRIVAARYTADVMVEATLDAYALALTRRRARFPIAGVGRRPEVARHERPAAEWSDAPSIEASSRSIGGAAPSPAKRPVAT